MCDSCRLCTTTPEAVRVRVNNTYSDEFGVKVGVHQGLVLSPLLFVIVLEALSREFRTGTPWELLYADEVLAVTPSTVLDAHIGYTRNVVV